MSQYLRTRARAWNARLVWALALPLLFAQAAAAETLMLEGALARARDADPGLAATAARLDAARAGLDQAARRPNPTLSLTGENLGVAKSSGQVTETTLSYNQIIERGGKRDARMAVANAELDAARLAQTIRLLDVYEAVEIAWVEALTAESQIGLAADRLASAQRLAADTRRRVEAARDPAFAGSRVATLATQAEIQLGQAQAAARIARATLASYWNGGAEIEVDVRALRVGDVPAAPPEQPLDLAVLQSRVGLASAQVTAEQARAVQDPTLQAGVRHFGRSNSMALIAGVSVPLGFRDRNQGNIARAQAERRAAEADITVARVAWERAFTQLRARLDAQAIEARRLEEETIPAAETTLSQARSAFDRGAFSYLEVIEAERALADARGRRIDVLKQYNLDLARLNRIAGTHAASVSKEIP
jgi:cobalt-zinc-cadmium efflux system outer membrane protein